MESGVGPSSAGVHRVRLDQDQCPGISWNGNKDSSKNS